MVIKEEFPRPTATQVSFSLHHGQHWLDGMDVMPFHHALANRLKSFAVPTRFSWRLDTRSLEVYSSPHKAYNLGHGEKLRDMIEWVSESFFALVPMKTVPGLGLTYRNLMPLQSKTNDTLASHYYSSFPVERFSIEIAKDMRLNAMVRRGDCLFRYFECLVEEKGLDRLLLVLDGLSENVAVEDCMEVTDRLHDMISDEFEKTIKQPVYDYMRMKPS